MALPDDTVLNAQLDHLRQTNPAGFIELLFKTFYAPLGAVVYRVVPDRAVVEDLLQDVFARLWQGRQTLPAIDSYRAYLTRMALNAALRHRQRGQRQVAWDDETTPAAAPVAPDALAALHADEASAAIAAALAKLPPQCRVIFELSRYEELTYQQIAEALELAPKTVENQMGKALRILRRELAGVLRNLYGVLLCLAALAGGARPAAPARRPTRPAYLRGPGGGSGPVAYLVSRPAVCQPHTRAISYRSPPSCPPAL